MRTTWTAFLLLAACGSDGGGGGDGPTAAQDLASYPDLVPASGDLAGAYPAGPYGYMVGDTITPLVWEGYRDDLADAIATTKTYGSYTMNDLRNSGRPYALLHVTEMF